MSVLMRRENTLIIEPGSDISKIQIINFILLPNSKKHFEGPPLYLRVKEMIPGALHRFYNSTEIIECEKARIYIKQAELKNLFGCVSSIVENNFEMNVKTETHIKPSFKLLILMLNVSTQKRQIADELQILISKQTTKIQKPLPTYESTYQLPEFINYVSKTQKFEFFKQCFLFTQNYNYDKELKDTVMLYFGITAQMRKEMINRLQRFAYDECKQYICQNVIHLFLKDTEICKDFKYKGEHLTYRVMTMLCLKTTEHTIKLDEELIILGVQ
ncbi:Hypothetical_protein [Hexamita inflata]|uniref:Hypothetical_protein n=1 Tax=Hexamita inflata TaxID=28002 RepID=A0AA86PNJ7_9EUKA|nr:Hypothetical protein HINF_LOCUS29157 [Hexamita inflata]